METNNSEPMEVNPSEAQSNGDAKADAESKAIEEDEPELIENEVTLSWFDSDLNLTIDKPSLVSAKPICEGRFARIWAGARATHGFTQGKLCYQVKILEQMDVSDCVYIKRELLPHLIRVGWSTYDASLQLGESPNSYCLDSSGKIFENLKFKSYGRLFNKKNDVITVYLDFTGENVVMDFTLNGTDLGEAFSFPKSDLQGKALCPHILTKNIKFEVNFGQVAPWGDIKPDFQLVSNIPLEQRTRGPRAPGSREECEVILVCGLPACGKTYWTTNYVKENPEKRYTVISINALVDKMKINGIPRKLKTDVYEGPNVKCLEKLMHIGCHRRRNYILDQTSWKRKIRSFENFIQKAVIIVPELEEYRRRANQQVQDGERYVSDSDTYDVTSKYSLPDPSLFAEVIYPELGPDKLQAVMDTITSEAKEKFAKIAADAKSNPKKVPPNSQPQKKKQTHSLRGGFMSNPSKRMKGNYGGDGYSFSNYSTTYPLKRPIPGFQGGNWRPAVVTSMAGRASFGSSMGSSLLGPRGSLGPPRGYMSPPNYRNGMPNFGPGPGGPQRRVPPNNRMGSRDYNRSGPPGGGPWGGAPADYTANGGDYYDDDHTDRSEWGRWWNTEGRKMYGRWLASNY